MSWFARSTATNTARLTEQPLLDADDFASLAAHAADLARARVQREVHDHHAGDWPSAWLGRGLDFEEARPYSPGDDTRDMDWRTTARLGHPFVKTYREERQAMLHLVLDRGATMRFGTRRRLKLAQAARVAALAAFAASMRSIAVGATLWEAMDADLVLAPRHDRAGILTMLQASAAAAPPLPRNAGETTRDADRLHRLAELPRGTRLLLASDFTWLDESHERPLALLAERVDLLAVRIIDPAERALPDFGLARVHEIGGDNVRWLDTGSVTARAEHAAAFVLRSEQIEALLARTGARTLEIGSEVDDIALAFHGHG
jgi:uncharacterized protein (DUF58 family)